MTPCKVLRPAVAVVGAGPSGLTAAAELARELPGQVLVLERERQAGGVPRHCDHQGFGLRDLRRFMSGPDYAERLVRGASGAGATLLTQAMVTRADGDRTLTVTTPDGITVVQPEALILATGARERPRAARLVAGDRPPGVYTTGQLQNAVHLRSGGLGSRAVVVGAELVSWSAVLTLRKADCKTVLMTTTYRQPDSYRPLSMMGRALLRVPVAPATRVVGIEGHKRLEAVLVEDMATGATRRIACDTVIFTGDWIPDNELARAAGLDMNWSSRAPAVDMALRTSEPGIFAIGNLVHPVDTADAAAIDGRHAVKAVLDWLRTGSVAKPSAVLTVDAPLRWVAPSRWTPGDPGPARNRLLSWCDEFTSIPTLVVHADGREVSRHRLAWPAAPGRIFRIPSSVLTHVAPSAAEVRLSVQR